MGFYPHNACIAGADGHDLSRNACQHLSTGHSFDECNFASPPYPCLLGTDDYPSPSNSAAAISMAAYVHETAKCGVSVQQMNTLSQPAC
mmetsp:Transcript_12985/g.39303  ORF Transcript_12985/g.39303 Transcript_12985/m.39303 type:complete len:89 (-) Transcript_12985:67-333(-)